MLKITKTTSIRMNGSFGKGFLLLLPLVIKKYGYMSYTAETWENGCVLQPDFRKFTTNSLAPEIEISLVSDNDTTTLHLRGHPVAFVRGFLQFYFCFLFFFFGISLVVWAFEGLDSPMFLMVPLFMGGGVYFLTKLSIETTFRKVVRAIEQGFPGKFTERMEGIYMTKQEVFLSGLFEKGLVDQRKIAVVANAKSLPRGEFGLCLLCLKGSLLGVYDTNFKQDIGPLLYEIDLKNISALKGSSFVFNRYLKFTYNSFHYKFADFGNAKEFIAGVSAEVGA